MGANRMPPGPHMGQHIGTSRSDRFFSGTFALVHMTTSKTIAATESFALYQDPLNIHLQLEDCEIIFLCF